MQTLSYTELTIYSQAMAMVVIATAKE